MLEQSVKVEELQKKLVYGEYLPQLAIGAAGIYNDMMDKTTTNGLIFATLSVPITDWWGGSHKIRESSAKVAAAQYKLMQTSQLLNLQINKALNDLYENYYQIQVASKSVEQSKENLKITQDNYKAGIVSVSELLEAQAAYQETLNNQTETICNYKIALAKYLQATNKYLK